MRLCPGSLPLCQSSAGDADTHWALGCRGETLVSTQNNRKERAIDSAQFFFFCLYINDRSILDLYREDEDEEDIFIDCIEFRNASPLSWLCVLLIQCDLDLQLAAGGSHRTLLYGQAVLFLHSNSSMVSADATQKQANRFIGPVVLKKRLFISSTSAACPHLGPPLTSWLLMSVCRKIKKVSQWRISSLLLWWWLEYISVNRNTSKW